MMDSYEFEFKGLKYKITHTTTLDKGSFYTLWAWADRVEGWVVIADSRPPINLSSAAIDMYVAADFSRRLS